MKLSLTSDARANRRFVLLSPPGSSPREAFHNVEGDAEWREKLLADMQRLRGHVYLTDGAISERDLTADGRHVQPIDEKSWHLLTLSSGNRVVGCARYLLHSASTSFGRLRVRNSALGRSEHWSEPFRHAVEHELETARRNGFSFVELGGWAIDESLRGSTDAVRIALFTYAWCQVLGGCLGISMATHRNGSASILRRIGGRPLEWNGNTLPAYFDAQYKCDMEVIRFDSRFPSTRYQQAVAEIRSQIADVPVVCTAKPVSAWDLFVDHLQNPAVGLIPWESETTPSLL